jgi:alkyl sulfatase BDS1-like metallo-beta-lactamase superfamily hydrolase
LVAGNARASTQAVPLGMEHRDTETPRPASFATIDRNTRAARSLPFHDRADFELAQRGRIAFPEPGPIMGPIGLPVWDPDQFAFLDDDEVPDSVHPSLWRQGQLNRFAGLFEVAEGFYQVRGLDLSNVTFIAGDTGWIVIDPLTSTETARAALDLLHAHVDARPVVAVIYTHSHVDHFAGVRGVVEETNVRAGSVEIIAPDGFLHEAVSENVIAGNAMGRRASYMYGALLPRGPRGHVDAGLGKGIPVLASQGLIAPTTVIEHSPDERIVDGLRIVFQLTPGTEAPAEMNFFFPDRRILCMAENCTATMHNLYTLRGAQVRDALKWSKYIDESIEWFGSDTDIVFASHHWPRWGNTEAMAYLRTQRDAYRYVHDETMRMANHGMTMNEIAEELVLPDSLATHFHNRDYYGTVNHNAKAVYQRYLGWFDGNPAHLHPHPPVEAGRRYVEFMGGPDEVVRKARESFAVGDYRWVAEVVNHVVFAFPDHDAARSLQADALEQLGYQSESGPWRGFYLTGAQELRHGTLRGLPGGGLGGADITAAMTTEMLLDYLGVRLNGPEAAAADPIAFDLVVSDRDEAWHVGVEHGVLHVASRRDVAATATLTCDWPCLVAIATGNDTVEAARAERRADVAGDPSTVARFFALLDSFEFWFDIVTP